MDAVGQTRLPFELDVRAETAALTAYGGVPLLIEAFRAGGAAAVLAAAVAVKRHQRVQATSELIEGLLALWAAGGERCEDLAQLREDAALALLLGHAIPAPQTVRDFLEALDEAAPPLWQGERCAVLAEGERLQGLAAGCPAAGRLAAGAGATGQGDDRCRCDHSGVSEAGRPADL